VRAHGLSRNTEGVGHLAGYEVHASGLLPGESGDVTIEHVNRRTSRARGRVVERRTTLAGRQRAPCRNYGRCTGCPLMEIDVRTQRDLKRREIERRHGLRLDDLVFVDDDGLNYRWSSKRVFGGRRGHVVLGSYRHGTHRVESMRGCLVDHPGIAAAADELERVANEIGAVPYHETRNTGELRYAWFKVNERGEVLVTIITAEPCSPSVRAIARRLTTVVGVVWGVNASRGNAIRGIGLRPIRGRQSLETEIAGVKFHIGPQGFLQPNPRVAAHAYEALVRRSDGSLRRGQLAVDLYAGAGVTTALLRRFYDVVLPCESYPESALALGIRPRSADEFLNELIGDRHHPHRLVDLVVANPPRGGLGERVCDALNHLRAPRLHIMSCNAASLSEDLKQLTHRDGRYRLVKVRGFDTLPQTSHLELVAWLRSRG
jgi:23S rRNA (uracil1939-C5)-methyltransferase